MDSLIVRPLNEDDYEHILMEWWRQWGWRAPMRDFLPDNGTGGIMIMDGDIPVCAGFMYLTNSKVAWVDWIISNREYNERDTRKKAIKLLVDSLTNICKSSGAKYAYALIKNESLIKTYEAVGYFKGDSYAHEMRKPL
jgi:hypothetical protein